MGAPLDNDPSNLCIGCGPENPIGLRLAFERAAGGAATQLLVRAEHQGAPERLHSAILYLAMTETANWSVYSELGRIGLPVSTGALETKRWVGVGERIVFRGVWRADARAVDVEATDERGQCVARLTRAFALPTQREFMERMGYDALPTALDGLLPGE